jgi:hypothetical protein
MSALAVLCMTASAPTIWISGKEVVVVRVHRVYFCGGLYTDQAAASAAAARLYAERLFPKLGASVKTECNLHSYRRRLAARFNYDAARLGAYIDSLPTAPGSRIIEIPARKTHPTRKSA